MENLNSSNNNFDNDDIDLKKFFKKLLRRKFLIIGITGITTSLGIIYSLIKTPIWQGDFLIVVKNTDQSKKLNPLKGDFANIGPLNLFSPQNQDLKTQQEILKSPSVLLPVYNFVIKENNKKGYEPTTLPYEKWLKKSLEIDFKKGTKVLSVKFSHRDKSIIKNTLNMISDRYKDFSKRERNKYLKDTISFLKEMQVFASDKYQKSVEKFNKFSIDNGLGSIDGFVNINQNSNLDFDVDLLSNDQGLNMEALAKNRFNNKKQKSAGIRFQNQFNLLENYESTYVDLSAKLKPESKTLKELKIKIDHLRESLKRPNEILIAYKNLEREAFRNESFLKNIETELLSIKVEKAKKTNAWEIISEPKVFENRLSPRRKNITIQFFFIGAIISILITLIKDNKENLLFELEEFRTFLPFEYLDNIFKDDLTFNKLFFKKLQEENISEEKTFGLLSLDNDFFNNNPINLKRYSDGNDIKIISFQELKENKFKKIILLASSGQISYENLKKLNSYLSLRKESIIGWVYLKD